MYNIPARYRRMENLHIVFWLFKDVSWCLTWKITGMLMILPTLAIAIFISWRTRQIKSELAHNLAVTFWIAANSYWMIVEFFGVDEVELFSWVTLKHVALIPFFIGIIILAHYYLLVRPKESKEQLPVTL